MIYLLVEGLAWFCLILNGVLKLAYPQEEIKTPVRILGYSRSGPTNLLRLVTSDPRGFSAIIRQRSL